MDKHRDTSTEQGVVERRAWMDVVAVLVCLLVAFLTWLASMNMTSTDYLCIDTSALPEGYVLSVTEIEVTGRVCDLRGKKTVALRPMSGLSVGTYSVAQEDLILPEGLAVTEMPAIVLTVGAK